MRATIGGRGPAILIGIVAMIGAGTGAAAPPAAFGDDGHAAAARDGDHYHGDGCGHFFAGGAWYDFPPGHVHGPRCGHFLVNGTWSRFPAEHRHGPGCGHYFHNGEWHYFPSAHRHSPGCGHHFWGGEWHLFPEGHVHGPECGHHFYNGAWHLFPEGHVHGGGCGHAFVDGEWRPAAGAVAEIEARAVEPEALDEEAALAPRHPAPDEAGMLELRPPPAERQRPIVIEPREQTKSFVLSAPIVVVNPRHRHGVGCGHFYWDGGWHGSPPVARHVHGAGCGHYYWMSDRRYHDRPYPRAPVHEHRIGCGHYYWGGGWHVEPRAVYGAPSRGGPVRWDSR